MTAQQIADEALRLDRIRRALSPDALAALRLADGGALPGSRLTYDVARELVRHGLLPSVSGSLLTPDGAAIAAHLADGGDHA